MVTSPEVQEDIRHRLASAQLPALPQVLLQVMQQCEAEDSGLAEIAGVMRRDTAIAARILGIARSPYYNRGRPPQDLEACLAVLGTQTVRQIALNQAVLDLFGRFRGSAQTDLAAFWCHALLTALLASQLAKQFDYPRIEEAYLAGLLHDLGRLALLQAMPEVYGPLFEAGLDEKLLVLQERERFGLDHAEAGGWLAERWQLEPLFCDSLRYHHESSARFAGAHPLVRIVALAERLGSVDWAAEEAATWGLEAAQAETILDRARKNLKEIADQFGITITDPPAPTAAASATDQATLARLAQVTSSQLLAAVALDDAACPAGVDEAYAGLVRAAELLFGTRGAALFEPHDDGLRGVSPDRRDPRLEEVRIRLPAPDSAIARAHAGRAEIIQPDAARDSLADSHVSRLLGVEALVCLPLIHAGLRMGVLVLGIDTAGAAALRARQGLLAAYASLAGRRFHDTRLRSTTLAQARQTVAEECLLRARQAIHEAANPLGVVHNYLALLRDRLANEPESAQEIDLMREELRRVSGILQTLRQAEVPRDTTPQRVDINALIRQVLDFCRKGKPEMARIQTEFEADEGLPPVIVDRDKLKQVLINLIFNAVEAMPQGGRLSLSSARWVGARGEESVEITVQDDGPGIPAEVLERLYAPVSSRKGGSHAGLGLAIVGRLAEELGAVIQCHSTPAGTRFKLLLPVVVRNAAEGTAA